MLMKDVHYSANDKTLYLFVIGCFEEVCLRNLRSRFVKDEVLVHEQIYKQMINRDYGEGDSAIYP